MNEKDGKTVKPRMTALLLVAALLMGALGAGSEGAIAARNRHGAKKLQSFSNGTAIAIPSNAMSIPTSIAVSGFDTPIADVDVSLNILTHPAASDLDILLVGPGGQMALIMSDGGGPAANDSLTFSDQAATQLGSSDALTSGTFQPTNYDFSSATDVFVSPPAPVNTPPSGSSLAVFNGTNANGTWTLFVREQDNVPVETGTIAAGWSLRITTANGVPVTESDQFQATAGQTLSVEAAGVLENDSDPDGDFLTATLAGEPRKGKVTLEPDGAFTYTPGKKARGTDDFSYLAQDARGLTALDTVTIQIKGKKKKGKK